MNIPAEIKSLMQTFVDAGYQIYVVGGAVRELLLGKTEVENWDFTTDAKPEQVSKLLPNSFSNNKFGTVGLESSAGLMEITTMRKEGGYRDFRHPDEVAWTSKLEEDLNRRDFTINAIALGIDGRIVDPHGGEVDLRSKVIKAVGDPDQRFQEDALRLIRAIRISSQLDFEIEFQTLRSLKSHAHLISEVANERIRDELLKLLLSDNAYKGVIKLREVGLLQIILPEVERCFGIAQTGDRKARHYDVGEHLLLSLKECPSKNPMVRLACLLHDIGKVDTINIEDDGNVTFYQHDIVGAKQVQAISKRFNLSRQQSDKLYRLVRWHLFTVDERQTDSAIRRFIKNVGVANVSDMISLRIADRIGGGTQKAVSWRMERFQERIKQVLKKPFSISDLKINGKDVMGVLKLKPSPKVGEILNKLFEEVQADDSKNNKEYLLQRIKDLG